MSEISSRVVRRSHDLLRQASVGYGSDFSFREVALAADESAARAMARSHAQMSSAAGPKLVARLVKAGKLPSPGAGPSAETRARSWFRMYAVARGERADERAVVSVTEIFAEIFAEIEIAAPDRARARANT